MGWQDDPTVGQAPPVAPRGTWRDDPLAADVNNPAKGIDLSGPIEQVRAAIGQLPPEQRQAALKQWADTYVANERANAQKSTLGQIGQAGSDVTRSLARGSPIGSYIDKMEAGTSGALNSATGGYLGSPYDEALAYQQATDRATDKEVPGVSLASKLVGGYYSLAPFLGGGGAATKTVATEAPSLPARIGNFIGSQVKAAPKNVAIGAGLGGVYGYGENGTEGAIEGAEGGALAGLALPPLLEGGAALGSAALKSPLLARLNANIKEAGTNTLKRIMPPMSVSSPAPEISAGAQAAGDQMLANQAERAGIDQNRLQQIVDNADYAAKYTGNSLAQNKLAVVDLDPALGRLAGSIARSNPEAANRMADFSYGRQTGMDPFGGPLGPETGIPTRAKLSAPPDPDNPMGQMERVQDALTRAFELRDYKYHGNQETGYGTMQRLAKDQAAEAQKLYPQAMANAQDFNITQPMAELRAQQDQLNDPQSRGMFQRAMKLFTDPQTGRVYGDATDLPRFDLAKQRLDDLISDAQPKSYIQRQLNEFRQNLLDAVHGGDRNNPTINQDYANARNSFSSKARMQDAYDMGKNAFKEGSDVAVDQINDLAPATPTGAASGEQKMFRLGLIESYRNRAGSMPRGSDTTKIFDTPNSQAILEAAIPRSPGKSDVFADRPQRFGTYLNNEQRMVQTNREVFGNSKTAERIKDDEAFEQMRGVVENLASKGLTRSAVEWTANALGKLFGARPDAANAMAQRLFTADPIARQNAIAAIGKRLGPNVMGQLQQVLQANGARITGAAATNQPGSGNP